MKRNRKSLLLTLNWVLLSFGTSILIILTQPTAPVPAQEPAANSQQQLREILQRSTPNPTETPKPVIIPQPTPSPSPEVTEPKKPDAATEPEPTPEEIARQQKFIEADKLYQAGQIAEAEKIYREVKEPFAKTSQPQERKAAITDPTQLSPAGKVYWREAEAGIAKKLESRTLIPLQLLVEQYPEFIPGHIKFAEVLKQYNRSPQALDILERGASLYPDQPELIKARVTALAEAQKWMEASLAARQFAILNPKDPQAPEFANLADVHLKRYKSHIQAEIRGNAIANILTGALGYAVSGSLLGPFSALDSTIMLLRGEESIGESVAKQAKQELKQITDETVVAYVNEIGQKLAKVAGRNEFKYEFFVVPQEELNAFALPGGKIFINAGAIAKTNSEAELAGLIGHELSHVVLSHGFQLVTQGNLVANVTQYIPLGGIIGQLSALSYSRDMERQADSLGTRLIVATGYAADGLRNLMVTLEKQQKNAPPRWLSSHPGGSERVSYLEAMITNSKYNRYAYEGVERHAQIQAKVKQLLKEKKSQEEKKQRS
ncbi:MULTISPECIES: M48 family metalloprotease [unclassified Tolypothrix]|uniref:M48 family metalloprotease n=1 Tax=unclassified Tolypothrix TaxID=2649714 RepID=UPI0005EAC2B2|nr:MULTISPECIES: M48 family metalloprotease [unclassified Tolypothrix]BAY89885.1 peptidase M48 Ste24p [Microchaete diplosiphon NIES-3275]EKF00999.1 peptidase, M48 family [Tolypothrix sp. PCC 7601]MBE9082172.1 M48 family metalloprotease [Tolypothrix sp. LEGE 11397]UYD24124.1 M48 family metalloprotease [Tolypothrix sp. PCC 7712]UYD33644.1 M48 family metalloprotease [Tolypothrix sp. PCC 7601]